MVYDYVIVGAGISGCSVAYELSKHSNNLLLIDKGSSVAFGASGAAGAFLSPLLGKPNDFKDLVTKSLKYSTTLYQRNFPFLIESCGTTRIPKDEKDKEKFKEYIPYMDFSYSQDGDGYLFDIASVVNSVGICKTMTTSFNSNRKKIETKFNFDVDDISYDGEYWLLNNEIKTKKLILTTGANLKLIDEFYLKIRAVWGRRIDVTTTTNLKHNYHKQCSVSKSFPISDDKYRVSIGATHHRDLKDIENSIQDIDELLIKSQDIVELKDIDVVKEYIGARACSVDYFPMVGEIIDSSKTLEEFPYLKNGTNVNKDRFTRYKNLYILNGVGGRGFVLAPYLAKQLVDNIIDKKPIDDNLTIDRLFIREVKRIKN
ncbi:MAG: FAD-dependent oxidoreductase [Campylobacterota bacterium]|nr:FAD-dependent oxidoreductase [Campylobacterota bacterium]